MNRLFRKLTVMLIVMTAISVFSCTRMTMLDLEFDDMSDWSTYQSEHFVFHYRVGTTAGNDVEQLAIEQEAVLSAVQDSLGSDYPGVIHYYLYDYSDSEFTLKSSKKGGHIDPVHSSIYIGYSGGNLYSSDLIKLIAEKYFGHAGSDLMYEGFSHATLSEYRGVDLESMVLSLKENYFHILNINSMLYDKFTYSAIQVDHFSTYYWSFVYLTEKIDIYSPQCGYFVRYLIDRFGLPKVAELYNAPSESFNEEMERIFGIPASQIESDYLAGLN